MDLPSREDASENCCDLAWPPVVGAYLVITADPLHASLPNGTSDLIGILLSVASSLSMAMLVVLTGYLARGPSNPANIYVQQTLALIVTYIVLSIAGR